MEESTKTSVVEKITFLRDSYHFKDGDKTFVFHLFRNHNHNFPKNSEIHLLFIAESKKMISLSLFFRSLWVLTGMIVH